MTKKIADLCSRCGRFHTLHGSTSAVGLFSRPVPMYRARYAGSPLRATREEAHADMCDHLLLPRRRRPSYA